MVVEAKFTSAGMTKGKRYDVITKLDSLESVVIALDDGTIAVRRMCAFNIIDSEEEMNEDKCKRTMLKCSFCESSSSDGICKWEVFNMIGSKESSCKKAIERMMRVLQNTSDKKKK